MITHYIIMSSSYYKGKRIALDFPIDENIQGDSFKDKLNSIMAMCGKDVALSTHFIQTDSPSWESVLEKDSFFKEVEVITTLEQFIKLIEKDRDLIGVDIAKYIVSKTNSTHFKIETLVYFCYSDYLIETGEELFKDKILAYEFGPIVQTVYEKYKEYDYNDIENEEITIDSENVFELPARSRIMFAKDGISKLMNIEKTLNKYKELSSIDLQKIIRRDSTPWSVTNLNSEIKNDTIKKFHINEKV